jgi:hypothetical protein
MASEPIIAPYGDWESPITPDIVSGSSLGFKEVHVHVGSSTMSEGLILMCFKSSDIYIVESRPSEKGRCAVVQVNLPVGNGHSVDRLNTAYSVRSKVHEYGGGAMTIDPNGNFILTDANTDGIFRVQPTGELGEEVIKADKNFRYADFDVHPSDSQFILAVQEEHKEKEVINTIVVINAARKRAEIVIEGADFYSHPKFSHSGKKVSWMQWNHPDMPWTGSELYVADWQDGKVLNAIKIAGKAREESINQPKWHLDDTVLFASDASGFYQLYRYNFRTQKTDRLDLGGYQDAELAGREFILGT